MILNVHFDKPSDPSTSALNVVLGNLSLHQLVKVPTHWRGHSLDCLITNRVTDVLDLTIVDMLLSDHFVISFDRLLRKPAGEKKKIISERLICMIVGQMFIIYLGQPLSLTQLIP